MTNTQDIKQVIISYISNGLCALPANSKQKRPVVPWKQFQDRVPSVQEIDQWFNTYNNIDAIAIICGAISGNLEVIDFDWGGKSLEDWGEQVSNLGLDYSIFPIEETQSHGFHLFYRSTSDVEGNTKLTWVNFSDDELEDVMGKKYYHGKEVLKGRDGLYGGCTIETRGQGGLIICAPSAGYKMLKGSWLDIPVIDRREVSIIKNAAINLSTAVLDPPKRESSYSAPAVVNPSSFSSADYLRQTNATAEILARNGWTFVGLYNGDGDCELWRRPGKSQGVSGLRHADDGRFHVWTTSTELEGGRMYSPLQLLAALEYGGNENVASRAVFDMVAPTGLGNTPSYLMDTSYLTYTWDSLVSSARGGEVEAVEEKEEKPFEFKSRRSLLESYPKLPKKLRNLGDNSFFTMFKDKCEKDSGIKQDELYFASAMVTLAHIIGDKVHHGSAYPNLYCICTAESGCGKNAPLSHARKISNFYKEHSVTNGFQSEQVMGDMFRENSKRIWIQDEFGQWLNRAYQKGKAGSLQYDVLRQCTDLWSKAGQIVMTGASRKNKELSKDESVGDKGVNEMTYKAYLSILNYTTPSSLQEFMNTAASECGTIARFFFPIGNADPEMKRVVRGDNEPTDAEKAVCMEWRDLGSIHKEDVVADDFGDFEDVSSQMPENVDYIPYNGFEIPVDQDAEEYMDKIWTSYKKRASLARFGESDEENLKEMLSRSFEFVEKFAMVFACDKYGANLSELRIDKDCVEKANLYQEYCIDCEKYLFKLISNNKTASESDFEKKLERLYSKLHQREGVVTWRMRDFTQAFRDKFTRDKVVQFLVESEIASPREVESKVGSGVVRKCTVFDIDCKKLREAY